MVGNASINCRIMSYLNGRTVKNKTIIVGLKSDNYSRQMLLQLLTVVVKSRDNVLAVHIQERDDGFDPNTFHIHEDLCKSKQVEFLVKVCTGNSYISVLSHQVRENYATILAIGCNPLRPKDSAVSTCLKTLPPTCTLLVMDDAGRILIQKQGTSQQGSAAVTLQSYLSSSQINSAIDQSTSRQLHKSLTIPSSSTSPTRCQIDSGGQYIVKKKVQDQFKKSYTMPSSSASSSTWQMHGGGWQRQSLNKNGNARRRFQRIAFPEAERSCRCFRSEELSAATDNFSPAMLIGKGGNSMVYRANLENGQAAAVKVLKTSRWSSKDLLREAEMLSSIKHDNIVEIIGYCDSMELRAIVYNLLKGSLKQCLKQLKWAERMSIAIGVAKALEYLHHFCDPPIIHRNVKPSNILLFDNCQPQLSDFGAAIVHHQSYQVPNTKPIDIVKTFGYLAPEYIVCGKMDEKIDVYSYGVVLLELITGKEAIQSNQKNHESLVLWARSLLCFGLVERLVDPSLSRNYKKEEVEVMMFIARLCLMHSSSQRPTMKMILRLFEDSEYWLEMQREKDQLLNGFDSTTEKDLWRQYELSSVGNLAMYDT